MTQATDSKSSPFNAIAAGLGTLLFVCIIAAINAYEKLAISKEQLFDWMQVLTSCAVLLVSAGLLLSKAERDGRSLFTHSKEIGEACEILGLFTAGAALAGAIMKLL